MNHAFRKATMDPSAHGWPEDPLLRIPILAWVLRDPSPFAQNYARGIWDSFPPEIQEECRTTLGIHL